MRILFLIFILIMPVEVRAQNILEQIIGGAIKSTLSKRDFRKNGEYCLYGENQRKAIQACTRALKYKISRNDNGNLFSARGTHYMELGNHKQALHDFHKALKYVPTHSFALNNIGLIKEKNGELEEAVRYFEKAAKYDRQFQNNYLQAKQALDGLLESEKVHVERTTGWCQVWKGSRLVEQEQCKKISKCDGYDICEFHHIWPSGSRTRLHYGDSYLEAINDRPAKEVFILKQPCARNTKSGNIFCFMKQRFDGVYAEVSEEYPHEEEVDEKPKSSGPFIATSGTPQACYHNLRTLPYDQAMENGCWKYYSQCFAATGLTSEVRKSETRPQCLKFLAAYAAGDSTGSFIERHMTAYELLENEKSTSVLTNEERSRLYEVTEQISWPCLNDVKTYGYEAVHENNKACRWQFDHIASPQEDIDIGWCSRWEAGRIYGYSYIHDQRCKSVRYCGEDSGEICEFVYEWLNGKRTKLEWVDGFPETVDGVSGDHVSFRDTDCIKEPRSRELFCFSEKRISTTSDGAFTTPWSEEQLRQEAKPAERTNNANIVASDAPPSNNCPIPQGHSSVEDAVQEFFRIYRSEASSAQNDGVCFFASALYYEGTPCMKRSSRKTLEGIMSTHGCPDRRKKTAHKTSQAKAPSASNNSCAQKTGKSQKHWDKVAQHHVTMGRNQGGFEQMKRERFTPQSNASGMAQMLCPGFHKVRQLPNACLSKPQRNGINSIFSDYRCNLLCSFSSEFPWCS